MRWPAGGALFRKQSASKQIAPRVGLTVEARLCTVQTHSSSVQLLYFTEFVCGRENERCVGIVKKGMLYLTTHSTHFIYCYMSSDIW